MRVLTSIVAGCLVAFSLSAPVAAENSKKWASKAWEAFRKKDYRAAREAFRKEAEGGDDAAQVFLGNMYWLGIGGSRNPAEALKWYRRAADAGSVPGYFSMGMAYRHGIGVPKDSEKSRFWYRKACATFAKAARDGLSVAQYIYGQCHDRERLAAYPDRTKTILWYRRAASQKFLPAQIALARTLLETPGTGPHVEEARRWLTAASDRGAFEAKLELAKLQLDRGATKPSIAAGERRLRKIAAEGYADAQYDLSVRLADGRMTPKSGDEAVRWLRAAANRGHGYAQIELARRLLRGDGLPRDIERAWFWLTLVGPDDDPALKPLVSEAKTQLTLEQRRRVEARARSWRRTPSPRSQPRLDPRTMPLPK